MTRLPGTRPTDPLLYFTRNDTADPRLGDRVNRGAGVYDSAQVVILGSPQEVIDKIIYEHELFANQRFLVQFSVGTLPHATIMRSIELYGTQVAPVVRRETATLPLPAER